MKNFYKIVMATSALALMTTGAYANDSTTDPTPIVESETSIENSADVVAATDLSPSEVKDVQQSLKDGGYTVNVDGNWGSQTMNAVHSFQLNNNLKATGVLDSQTLAALDVQVDDGKSIN